MSPINHSTHDHPLYKVNDNKDYICDGCGTRGSGARFSCRTYGCYFDLHEYCVICPNTNSSFNHPQRPPLNPMCTQQPSFPPAAPLPSQPFGFPYGVQCQPTPLQPFGIPYGVQYAPAPPPQGYCVPCPPHACYCVNSGWSFCRFR